MSRLVGHLRFICWFCDSEPPCLSTRTEMVMRMETGDVTQRLIPCPSCMRSFCCSPAHWEAAHTLHHRPSADWRDGLSHCQMNTFVRLQAKVDTKHSLLDRRGQLLWVPVRVKSRWVSLKGKTWEGEFDEEICKSYGMPRTIPPSSTFLISSASDTLSMPMTILYGLSKLNEDNAWTRKQTLTVHVRIFPSRMDIRKSEGPQVLGANIREVSCRLIFEEILHRLPEVNKLEVRIVLIDGNINQFANSSSCVVPRYRVAIHSIMKYARTFNHG